MFSWHAAVVGILNVQRAYKRQNTGAGESHFCHFLRLPDKDAGLLANGQTVKNCEILEHRCFAFYTRSPSGWTILRIYMATARLRLCFGEGEAMISPYHQHLCLPASPQAEELSGLGVKVLRLEKKVAGAEEECSRKVALEREETDKFREALNLQEM